MSKIYTRTGDDGQTNLIGRRCNKNDPSVEAYGAIDELNSLLGMAVIDAENKETIELIQKQLYLVSAELAGGEPKISNTDVTELERLIDTYSEKLPEINNFVVPRGYLHLARAVCRRAERRAVSTEPRKEVIAYLNRLSDLLFVLARIEAKEERFFK